MVGILDGYPPKSMLIASRYLIQTNNQTITQTIDQVTPFIWQGDVKFERLRRILSDQAAYMCLAVKNIKKTEKYPNLSHVTCIIHALHRVREFIRKENHQVDRMVAEIKKILLKSARRKQLFRLQTGLELPSSVIVSR